MSNQRLQTIFNWINLLSMVAFVTIVVLTIHLYLFCSHTEHTGLFLIMLICFVFGFYTQFGISQFHRPGVEMNRLPAFLSKLKRRK